jgi:hypothetical protein
LRNGPADDGVVPLDEARALVHDGNIFALDGTIADDEIAELVDTS